MSVEELVASAPLPGPEVVDLLRALLPPVEVDRSTVGSKAA
jgi:hypothetical protein